MRVAWGRTANHTGYGVAPDGHRFLISFLDPYLPRTREDFD
jgi:hypothetical protein